MKRIYSFIIGLYVKTNKNLWDWYIFYLYSIKSKIHEIENILSEKVQSKFFYKKKFSELYDENCDEIDFYEANEQFIFQS